MRFLKITAIFAGFFLVLFGFYFFVFARSQGTPVKSFSADLKTGGVDISWENNSNFTITNQILYRTNPSSTQEDKRKLYNGKGSDNNSVSDTSSPSCDSEDICSYSYELITDYSAGDNSQQFVTSTSLYIADSERVEINTSQDNASGSQVNTPVINFSCYSNSTSSAVFKTFADNIQTATGTIKNIDGFFVCKFNLSSLEKWKECTKDKLQANTPYTFYLDIDYIDLNGKSSKQQKFCTLKTLAESGDDTPSKLKAFSNSVDTIYINWKDNATSTPGSYKFEIQRMKLTPNAPTGTTSTVSQPNENTINVILKWTNNTTSTPYYHLIQKSTSSDFNDKYLFDYTYATNPKIRFVELIGGSHFPSKNSPPQNLSFVDNNVEEGTVYYYRIKECSIVNPSDYYTTQEKNEVLMRSESAKPKRACSWPSNPALKIVTPPYAPTGLSATANPDGTVTLNWAKNSKRYVVVQIYRGDNSGNYSMIDDISMASSTTNGSYTDIDTNPGTTYNYYLKNCVMSDNKSYCSIDSNTASVTTYNRLDVSVVSEDGVGQGKVRGEGIDCGLGGTDCSEFFAPGGTITLTAEPTTTPTSTFVGWEGACSGTKECVITTTASTTAKFASSTSAAGQQGGFKENVKFLASLSGIWGTAKDIFGSVFKGVNNFYKEVVLNNINLIGEKISGIFRKTKEYGKEFISPNVQAESDFDWNSYFVGVATVTTPYFKDSGLEPDTVYLYRVRVNYGGGKTSKWVDKFVAAKTLVDINGGKNEYAPVCIANSVCNFTIPKYQSSIIGEGRNLYPTSEFSESQCQTNADCGDVGRIGKTIQEKNF